MSESYHPELNHWMTNVPMGEFPESLNKTCKRVSDRIGWCGDVAADTINSWLKYGKVELGWGGEDGYELVPVSELVSAYANVFQFEDTNYGNLLDMISAVVKADDKQMAHDFMEQYTDFIQLKSDDSDAWKNDRKAALKVAASNIGYLSGYVDSDFRRKVALLFGATHPIFG